MPQADRIPKGAKAGITAAVVTRGWAAVSAGSVLTALAAIHMAFA
ncbi:hypothetical protein [Jannaschia formosa]|nr:hypothetical protein [Jannaschia formosa]